jgi:hypothetical protein
VTGKVTYNGKTLTSGTVGFLGEGGASDSAIIAADGTYTATKVPLGTVKVSVATSAPQGGGTMPQMPALPGMPAAQEAIPIPQKYRDANTSGLTFEVKRGSNQYDIPLQ